MSYHKSAQDETEAENNEAFCADEEVLIERRINKIVLETVSIYLPECSFSLAELFFNQLPGDCVSLS